MARIRTIKPEFFSDSKIVKMSIWARYVFIGLFTQADREGRFEWKEDDLQMRLLIWDRRQKMADILEELRENSLIVRYGKNQEYGYIKNFIKHQYVNPREGASSIPSPDQIDSEAVDGNVGYVYAYLAPIAKRVKVGMTIKNPDIRAKDLQSPEKLELIFSARVKDPKKIEADIHRRLGAHRKYGEWFDWCPEVEKTLQEYSSLLQKNDASARVTHASAPGTREGKGKEGKGERAYASQKWLEEIPSEDLAGLYLKYRADRKEIQHKADQLVLWCQKNGRVQKNYKAFLEIALDKDFGRRTPEDIRLKVMKTAVVDGKVVETPIPEAVELAKKMRLKY